MPTFIYDIESCPKWHNLFRFKTKKIRSGNKLILSRVNTVSNKALEKFEVYSKDDHSVHPAKNFPKFSIQQKV